jgi:translation initiation factor 5B
LLNAIKSSLKIPGLLFIDTPGHAAFTTLRKRGGSLADIAILVVDINEGLKPQTIESIDILKSNKVPFIVAATKIDLISGWNYDDSKFLLENVNSLDYGIQGEFEKKLYQLVEQVQAHGFPADRFDRVENYTKQIAIVPISSKSGEGIPELLMVLTGLAQKFLAQQLDVDENGPAKGTVLEVKEEKGLGMTIDAIIYNGTLRVNDTVVIGAIDAAIVTKVRALLEPGDCSDMRDQKSKFSQVKEVSAAAGVKIAAPGLEKAIAGMPLRSCPKEECEQVQKEIQDEIDSSIMEESENEGVIIKADTIGGLEALRNLLQEKNIPISSSSLGDVTKKDLARVEMMKEKNEQYGVLLGFNVKVPAEIKEYCAVKMINVFVNDVIYRIIDDYAHYIQNLKKTVELRELSSLVRPCKFSILKGYVFRQNNPAIVGVEIEVGKIKSGDPLMTSDGKSVSSAKSLQREQETVSVAEQGMQVAMSIEGVTVGRQINEGDFLYTDIPEEDFKKLKELKKYLSAREIEVMKEIAEIKRKNNPVWGVG